MKSGRPKLRIEVEPIMVHDSIPPRLKYGWSLIAPNGRCMAVGVQLYILKRTARQAAQRALKRMP